MLAFLLDMPRRVRTALWVTLFVLCCTLALSTWFEYQLRTQLSGVTDYGAQDELWNTFAMNREFMQFVAAVRLARRDPGALPELKLRYDILAGRVLDTQNGALNSLFGNTDTYRRLLAPVNGMFKAFDPAFERGITPDEVERLNRVVDALEPNFYLSMQQIQSHFSDRLVNNERLIVRLGDWRMAMLVLQFLLLLFFAAIALRELWRSETRSRELDDARSAALEASAAKTRFLAGVSHEMRTPLTAIIGYTEQALAQPRDDAQRRQLEHVLQSGNYLTGLIGNVLDVAKIEAGRVQLQEAPLSSAAVAEALSALFEPQAAAKGLAFTLTLDPGLPPGLLLDGGKWQQILINLIGNAIKFTDRGTVRVLLDCVDSGDGLLLRAMVRDTGLGIAPEEQDRLFNRFEQTASGKLVGGTGLGLAISRGYARHMGGDITVDSAAGHGSLFIATVRAQPTTLPAPQRPDAQPSLHGLRVAIAEDQEINRELMRDILLRAGATVFDTDNGLSILDELGRDPGYDCVLLDYNMPALDGVSTARALRARRWPGRAVLISAGLKPDESRLSTAGIDQWLPKPFSTLALVQAVRGETVAPPAAAGTAPLLLAEADALAQLGCTAQRWYELAARGLARIETLLDQRLAEADDGERRRHAHSARGIALQIGTPRLAHALGELEETPTERGDAAARDLFRQTLQALAALTPLSHIPAP
ncbi:hypothetical protein GCM10007860_22460 [Chitiniphilus shinanonensis]|uniref:histidine kinase n=1 Tax=Chitiniphilus shinanonensis TaxID=553088 RepID=A0ABQ6BX73_9NEIS|nr:ATP-binding protein [Chitiniphilus shinanonensis]GLS05096.1 hypothetical protein GCM10007860_22460 [Chitiniphilus shinanonensis]